MEEFIFWLKLGFHHILDWHGYDHMLFLWVTFIGIGFSKYKDALWKVSAFTIAHSLTLALVVFNLIPSSSLWVEAAIALSIALSAFWQWKKHVNQKLEVSLILIFTFGLIHGMGFSSLLISLLGNAENTTFPLIYFNLGLELGQIVFVLGLILVFEGLLRFQKLWIVYYVKISLIIGFMVGSTLFFERILGYIR